ncbi:MAG: PEP-CTERM sorting domain-containing protein, partial [Planctomycetota bacterium]
STEVAISSVRNQITQFEFEITVNETLLAGESYQNPILGSVDYRVFGILPDPTPSGFPSFQLVRSISGNDFYSLSPDASLRFSVSAAADLSDGLQVSELSGSGTVFEFNARELNQAPGRYHPPILTLDSDGTGRLVNANNASTFPNPPPPIGSGQLVNVSIGDEYDVSLNFEPSLSVAAVPEPGTVLLLAGGLAVCAFRYTRRKDARVTDDGS